MLRSRKRKGKLALQEIFAELVKSNLAIIGAFSQNFQKRLEIETARIEFEF